jgi:glycosyltransferase involved in cell wall biosynthesis
MDKRISIHVCTRDRPQELSLLLLSLLNQSYTAWDIVLIDEGQQPVLKNHVVACLFNQVQKDGHHVNTFLNPQPMGVCHARNLALEKDYFNNKFVCRVDDDVILCNEYLSVLMRTIEQGYDIASGVTPTMFTADYKRSDTFVKDIANKKEFDKEGNIIKYGDDCGVLYDFDFIKPAHEFRSCALFNKKCLHLRYPTNLSPVGFREECFMSFQALAEGLTIGVNTSAVAWHLVSPQGGCRFPDYQDKVQSDHKYFLRWAKRLYKNNAKFRNLFK